jgi:3-phenylpropionate/cinnamic acid dioxygenase small subunit
VTDKTEISSLVHAYARLLDEGDFEAVADLFERATWRSAMTGETRQGRAEVRAAYDGVRLYEGSPRTKHLITNLQIDHRPGAATATATCSFTVLHSPAAGVPIEIVLAGRYEDRVKKLNGRWWFADRLFLVDLVGDLSRHFR